MSWASRRRTVYVIGLITFFGLLIGIPLLNWYFAIPETCTDGIQNQTETAIDKGGPCALLDERTLSPHAVVWSRAFSVRDGSYNAIGYVENANDDAGVFAAPYRFKLYDSRNILVAEKEGVTFVMPGTVTLVFAGGIDTGNRAVARAYLEFTAPLVWERMYDVTEPITIVSKTITDVSATPRLSALIKNTSVADFRDVQFVAVVFDTAGNAFAGSSTVVPILEDGAQMEIVFTWPDPFLYVPGRIDVIPLLKPSAKK